MVYRAHLGVGVGGDDGRSIVGVQSGEGEGLVVRPVYPHGRLAAGRGLPLVEAVGGYETPPILERRPEQALSSNRTTAYGGQHSSADHALDGAVLTLPTSLAVVLLPHLLTNSHEAGSDHLVYRIQDTRPKGDVISLFK